MESVPYWELFIRCHFLLISQKPFDYLMPLFPWKRSRWMTDKQDFYLMTIVQLVCFCLSRYAVKAYRLCWLPVSAWCEILEATRPPGNDVSRLVAV